MLSLALLVGASDASAAPLDPAKATPAERAAAGKKFKAAEASFKRSDFARAAVEFEESYAIVPHPSTLLNAVEAWESAGNYLSAAKACLTLQREFPGTPDAAASEEKLRTLLPRLAKLTVAIAEGGTDLQIDAVAATPGSTVVEPGEHVLTARFGDRTAEKRVTLGAGADTTITLTAPEDAPPPSSARGGADEGGLPTPFPVFVFSAGAALTLASGAVLLWSALDTVSFKETFDLAPSELLLEEGKDRQLRTNVLIGTTVGLAAATAAIGVFTRWSEPSAPSITPVVTAQGGLVLVEFPTR